MSRLFFILSVFLGSLTLPGSAFALTCDSTPKRHAQALHGEISGEHTYSASIAEKWLFRLEPAPFGWDLRLRDKDGMDLSQITPPFRGVPNPREIYGWHFRNVANTGTNIGDVNAPQHTRLFQFSPSLSGTGGFRPSSGTVEQYPDEGRGWLRINDMGLADLEMGQKARMNYLAFNACLTWPKTAEETKAELDRASPDYLDEEREIMFTCGLDADTYGLLAWVLPRLLSADFDGDDGIDTVAPIIRKRDGRRGIVICRAGIRVSVIGYGDEDNRPDNSILLTPTSISYWRAGVFTGMNYPLAMYLL